MSGYLDDASVPPSSSSLLFAHLQQQSYHHRIPSTSTPKRHGRSRQEGEDDSYDDVDEGEDDELSITTWDSQEEERQAQEEWDESMRQLNLAIQVMVLPFLGKWLGRKWSYWAFSRFQQHGLTLSFFGISWLWTPTTIIPSSAVAALQP